MENKNVITNHLLMTSTTLYKFSHSITDNINISLNKIFNEYNKIRFKWWNLINRKYFIRNNLTNEEKYNIRKIKRWFK